jgi:hypothetical protein
MVLTRSGARRKAAAAEGRHAALLSAVKRCACGGLEAALAAIGPQGSPAVLAALATDYHGLLRAACRRWPYIVVRPLLRAYGESPDALAGMARALPEYDVKLHGLVLAGRADAVAALLGAYRRAGRAHEALAADGHYALHSSIHHPNVLALLLAEYGEPGCDAVLAALAARDHQALLEAACFEGRARATALLAAAYGPPGCAVFRQALSANSLLSRVSSAIIASDRPTSDGLARRNATLAALLAAMGEPDCAAALRAVSAWLEAPQSAASQDFGIRRFEPAQRLARILPDSLLARLAAAAPAAWALDPDAARALLSAPVRSSLALPRLLAVRRLPGGVAEPVAAFLRPRPWLLYSSAAADLVAAAAPLPPE